MRTVFVLGVVCYFRKLRPNYRFRRVSAYAKTYFGKCVLSWRVLYIKNRKKKGMKNDRDDPFVGTKFSFCYRNQSQAFYEFLIRKITRSGSHMVFARKTKQKRTCFENPQIHGSEIQQKKSQNSRLCGSAKSLFISRFLRLHYGFWRLISKRRAWKLRESAVPTDCVRKSPTWSWPTDAPTARW